MVTADEMRPSPFAVSVASSTGVELSHTSTFSPARNPSATTVTEPPCATSPAESEIVMTRSVTVSVAGSVYAAPNVFEKTARYSAPSSSATRVSVVSSASGMSVQSPPLRTCHCTAGSGSPVAAAVNDTSSPTTAVASSGSSVMRTTVPTSSEPAPWSATNEATHDSAEFQLIVISLVDHDWMWST